MNKAICLLLLIVLLNNELIGLNADHNRLIRVDGINPTCNRSPRCREYEVEAAVINVDKSLPFMGSSTCCFYFETDDDDQLIMAKILMPTYLGGEEYVSFHTGHYHTFVTNITASDNDLYRDVYINSTRATVEFHKSRDYKSVFDILILSYRKALPSGECRDNESYFNCFDSHICIDKHLKCDKYPHCPNGEDEENCSGQPEMIDYRPTISLALSILIGFMCLMLITTILCCVCKRSNTKGNSSNNSHRNRFMRLIGRANRHTSTQTPQQSSQVICTASQPPQPRPALNISHINRNSGGENGGGFMSSNEQQGQFYKPTIAPPSSTTTQPVIQPSAPEEPLNYSSNNKRKSDNNPPPPSYEEVVRKPDRY